MGPTVLGMCGKTGLFSFGNTCFLNSAIQCLSGVEDFMRYFISDEYKKDINKSNVLGHGGQVAETYGNLSKQLWFGNELVVVPKQLTEMVAKLWTQFAGFGAFQHQVAGNPIFIFLFSRIVSPLRMRIMLTGLTRVPQFLTGCTTRGPESHNGETLRTFAG